MTYVNWIVRNRTVWAFNFVNKGMVFNWIVSDKLQYLESFNFGQMNE